MIAHITLILLCQLAGEAFVRALGLGFPGPVVGMGLLLLLLMTWKPLAERLRSTANGLLAHLSLLFVPAGTGIVGQLDVVVTEGVGLMVALVVSTLVAIAVGALTFVAVARAVDA